MYSPNSTIFGSIIDLGQRLYFNSPPDHRKDDKFELLQSRIIEVQKQSTILSPSTPTASKRRPLTEVAIKGKGARQTFVNRDNVSSTKVKGQKEKVIVDPITGDQHRIWIDLQGQKCGERTYKKSGDVLVYKLENDERHGPATYTMKNKTVIKFQFVKGIRSGKATEEHPDYQIEFSYRNGKREGSATKTSYDDKKVKHTVSFEYKNDVREGPAIETYSDNGCTNNQIIFNFVKGKRHGQAERTIVDFVGMATKTRFNYVEGISDEIIVTEKIASISEESGPEIPKESVEQAATTNEAVKEEADEHPSEVLLDEPLTPPPTVRNQDLLIQKEDASLTEPTSPASEQETVSPASSSTCSSIDSLQESVSAPVSPSSEVDQGAVIVDSYPIKPVLEPISPSVKLKANTVSRVLNFEEAVMPELEKEVEYKFPLPIQDTLHLMTRYQDRVTHKINRIIHSVLVNNISHGPALEDHCDGSYTAFSFVEGVREGVAYKFSGSTIEIFEYQKGQSRKAVMGSQLTNFNGLRAISHLHGSETNVYLNMIEKVVYSSSPIPNKRRVGLLTPDTQFRILFSERIEDLSRIKESYLRFGFNPKKNQLGFTIGQYNTEGQIHGPTLSFLSDGSCLEKAFVIHGRAQGEAINFYKDRVYSLNYKDGLLEGKCIISLANKEKIEHIYHKNVRQGDNIKHFANGSKIHFMIRDGYIDGLSEFTDAHNTSVQLTEAQAGQILRLVNPTLKDIPAQPLRPIEENPQEVIQADYFN